ncbi:MAG TPA: glycosyltransferase [Saprospiraceae bacterium]|nr:glycosyltransferase [Saprospiraceae bacterium]
MDHPTLSIVMPVYNAGSYISQTVHSLLAQSFQDFELIIVDDSSTDNSVSIIHSFSDPRIRFFQNNENHGIVYTRNRGMSHMQGRFYAPFDADDIAMPHKFEKQIQFLIENADYGMIGSWAQLINEANQLLNKKWKLNASPEAIPWILLFRNYFVHSAMVIRREAIPVGMYTAGFDLVEDYKMCFDISRKWKVWNTPEYLVKYRIHKHSHSRRDRDKMINAERKVFDYVYQEMGLQFGEEVFECIQQFRKGNKDISLTDYRKVERWLYGLWRDMITQYGYSRALKKVIYYQWIKWVWSSRMTIIEAPWQLLRSPFIRE